MPSQEQIDKERERLGKSLTKRARVVEVYVCPTEGCPCYFGMDGMPDLATEWNYKADTSHRVDDDPFGNREALRTHTRAECPECREKRGEKVDRVRITTVVFLPETPDADLTIAKPVV